MIRTCPRCALRFRSESELSQHLSVDHGAEPIERFRYRAAHDVEPLYPDRTRREPGAVRRYLLVANQSLSRDALVSKVRALAADGPTSVYVVVPATHSTHYVDQHTFAEREVAEVEGHGEPDDVGTAQARFRLREAVDALRRGGIDAAGEVGVADPFRAVEDALQHVDVDEVVLSTLPEGFSRWLGADLPSRIQRRLGIPVTTLVTEG